MKARIDPDLCSGCGLCEENCPEVFEMDDDDTARVKMKDIPSSLEESVKEAADDCPEEAIIIEEDQN
jgi:ferredoxin